MSGLLEAAFGVALERLAPVVLLVLARVLPMTWLAPWLGWKGTAALTRTAVALVLTAAFTPLALASAPALPASWPALLLLGTREALVGASFAIAASVPIYALGWTGDLLDRFGGGPSTRPGPLGALHVAAGVVLFVLLGGHRLALAAFADGLVDVPVGAGLDEAGALALALGAGRIITAALTLTVAFALPAAVAFLVLEATLALLARVSPALGTWMESLSARALLSIAIALLSLSALLPRLGPTFVESVEAARNLLHL